MSAGQPFYRVREPSPHGSPVAKARPEYAAVSSRLFATWRTHRWPAEGHHITLQPPPVTMKRHTCLPNTDSHFAKVIQEYGSRLGDVQRVHLRVHPERCPAIAQRNVPSVQSGPFRTQ